MLTFPITPADIAEQWIKFSPINHSRKKSLQQGN